MTYTYTNIRRIKRGFSSKNKGNLIFLYKIDAPSCADDSHENQTDTWRLNIGSSFPILTCFEWRWRAGDFWPSASALPRWVTLVGGGGLHLRRWLDWWPSVASLLPNAYITSQESSFCGPLNAQCALRALKYGINNTDKKRKRSWHNTHYT